MLQKIDKMLTRLFQMVKKKKEILNKQQLQDLKKIAAVISGKFTIGKDKTIWTIKRRLKK